MQSYGCNENSIQREMYNCTHPHLKKDHKSCIVCKVTVCNFTLTVPKERQAY